MRLRDIGAKHGDRLIGHTIQRARRRDRRSVGGFDTKIRAPRLVLSRPASLRSNAVVTEKCYPATVAFQRCRAACLRKVHAGTRVSNAELIECCDGVCDAVGPAIRDVIAGERHGREARAGQGRQVLGVRTWGRNVALHLGPTGAVRHFEVPDRNVGGPNNRCDSRQPMVRILDIENKIPHKLHCAGTRPSWYR